jgi:hypothetical protein
MSPLLGSSNGTYLLNTNFLANLLVGVSLQLYWKNLDETFKNSTKIKYGRCKSGLITWRLLRCAGIPAAGPTRPLPY